MNQIKLFKGSTFNGLDGRYYLVTEDFTLSLETEKTIRPEDVITALIRSNKGIVIPEPEVSPADDFLMFRLATILKDDGIILTVGTFTFLDDLVRLRDTTQLTTPITANGKLMFNALLAMLRLFEDTTFNNGRDLLTIDVVYCNFLDIAYDFYDEFIKVIHEVTA